MESVAEEPLTVALASTEMPRFEDGVTSMQELLRQLAESIANEIMSAEADQLCDETGTSRNGYRERKLVTCVGTLDLRIPKTRRGTFFPDDVLVRYQRVDRALVSAIAEMYRTGTSTRKVQRIAQELGVERLSKDQVSAIAQSVRPPAIAEDSPYFQGADPRYGTFSQDGLDGTDPGQVRSECLKDVIARLEPFWKAYVTPPLLLGETVLVVTHGSVVRSLIKVIEGLSDEDIRKVDVPTGQPRVYEFECGIFGDLRLAGEGRYLDPDAAAKGAQEVRSLGSARVLHKAALVGYHGGTMFYGS